MALSKTHALVLAIALLRKYGKVNLKLIALALLPDAIRCYGLPRPLTHFEKHPNSGVASGLVFPSLEKLKDLDKEKAGKLEKHEEPDYHQVAIGDPTDVSTFIQMNLGKIEMIEFLGILIHLIQDANYDNYIRSLIDVRARYEEMFFFEGQSYDAKTVRGLIAQIELQEFRILSDIFEAESGISTVEFFEDQVFPTIEELFPADMAAITIKYIDLSDDGKSVTYDQNCKKAVEDLISVTTGLLDMTAFDLAQVA